MASLFDFDALEESEPLGTSCSDPSLAAVLEQAALFGTQAVGQEVLARALASVDLTDGDAAEGVAELISKHGARALGSSCAAAAEWAEALLSVPGSDKPSASSLWDVLAEAAASAMGATKQRLQRELTAPSVSTGCSVSSVLQEAVRAVVTFAVAGVPQNTKFVADAAADMVKEAQEAGLLDMAQAAVPWRRLAWACHVAGCPHREVFGTPDITASPDVARFVLEAIEALPGRAVAEGGAATWTAIATEPMPLLSATEWITEEEVAVLMEVAEEQQLWAPSVVNVGGATPPGYLSFGVRDETIRASDSAVINAERVGGRAAEIASALRARAAALCGLPGSHAEAPQLVRYAVGQHYAAHVDCCSQTDPTLWVAGQRVATLLTYLSDVPPGLAGGFTRFRRLGTDPDGVRVTPTRGRAILWPNVGCDGWPLGNSEHQAEPLVHADQHPDMAAAAPAPELRGRKVVLNIWIRERPLP